MLAKNIGRPVAPSPAMGETIQETSIAALRKIMLGSTALTTNRKKTYFPHT
jgi:hypothetical protein